MGERTLEEIGAELGISKERVRQLQDSGLRKLRWAYAELDAGRPLADVIADLRRMLEWKQHASEPRFKKKTGGARPTERPGTPDS